MANETVQARRDYASLHLTLALVFTRAGLLNDAGQGFRALQKTNPNSTIPSRLPANLKAIRH
ncbi:MAG TPA: hypothetical protein VIC84_00245 [Blastocatellia bacterium]